jgi:hypothetical protein
LKTDFLKGSIALVMKQELRHGVVGDEDVRITIVVVVGDGNTEALTWHS